MGLEILGPGPHTATKSHLRWQEGPMASDRNRVPVAEAFAAVPRAPFLPATERTLTECNVPVAIGHGQTNSQPSTVADMLELLDVRLGDRVLDLGAGSGWTSALLSVLVGAQGRVSGVERHRGLVDTAQTVLRSVDCENAEIVTAAPGQLGLPEAGPFDRILVSAGAEEIPDQLLDQLEIGGIMVIPVQGQMLKVNRDGRGAGVAALPRHGLCRCDPLVTAWSPRLPSGSPRPPAAAALPLSPPCRSACPPAVPALPKRLPSRSSRPSAAPALPQFPPFRSACPPAIPALSKRLPSGSARSSAERVAHTRQSLAGSMIVGPGIPAATDEPRDGDDESDEDERHEHIDVRTGELGPPRSRQQM